VSEAAELTLGRGREELGAAEALLDAGFPAQAVSRAYLAGFHAASAALAELGERPATSTGVISAFGRHVVGDEGVDHEIGRSLRRLYEDSREVDYGLADAPPEEARKAVDDAQRLVVATAAWLERRRDARPA
jgi:uncharacterized protein (UPF0332 family)